MGAVCRWWFLHGVNAVVFVLARSAEGGSQAVQGVCGGARITEKSCCLLCKKLLHVL